MEGTRFDAWTKLVARGASRRSLLKAAIAGLTGAAAGSRLVTPQPAAAFKLTMHGAATVGGIALGMEEVAKELQITTPLEGPPLPLSYWTYFQIIGCTTSFCVGKNGESYISFAGNESVQQVLRTAVGAGAIPNNASDGVELVEQMMIQLNPLLPDMFKDLVGGNFSADAHQGTDYYHFDGLTNADQFLGAWRNGIKTLMNEAVDAAKPVAGQPWQLADRNVALQKFGLACHATQDFYAHTNWIELQLNRMGSSAPAPQDFRAIADLTSALIDPSRESNMLSQFSGVVSGYFDPSSAVHFEEHIPYFSNPINGCPKNVNGYVCTKTPDRWAAASRVEEDWGKSCIPSAGACRNSVCSDLGADLPSPYEYCHYNINKDEIGSLQGQKVGPAGFTLFDYAFWAAMRATGELVETLRKMLLKRYQNDFVDGNCIFQNLFYDTNTNCCRRPLTSPFGRRPGRGWASVTQCVLADDTVTQEFTVELEGDVAGTEYGVFLDQDLEQYGNQFSHKGAHEFTVTKDGTIRFTGCLPVDHVARVVDVELLFRDDYRNGLVGKHQYIQQSFVPCECSPDYDDSGVCRDGQPH